MDPRLFREAKRILLEALALPPDARTAHVKTACTDRPDLAAEVFSLLDHEDSVAPLVAAGVVKLPGGMPARIGPYEIVDILGEGGMGVVYRGRQTAPIRRDVAVKVLHAGLDTGRILERFAWERRSLARMDHPNIARILDAGSEGDRPYVVIELVDGVPITTWCRENGSTIAQRLSLLESVCQAVQHAHDRGILHRDLKPGNILVRGVGGVPTPYVIDFGIAKALDETAAGAARLELTMDGQRVGTPAYMSPEQLAAAAGDVDVRTDVYALGVILYELLAGRRPYPDEHLTRSLSREDPPPPSRTAERRELKGDLDNICLMAIRPEPERRYASAAALGEDLRRHRTSQPVLASPDTWRYRAGKAARRHPAWTTLAVALLVFVGVGVGFLAYHARRLDAERDRALAAERLARQEADAAEGIASFLENLFIELDPVEEGRAPTSALELLDVGADRLADELGDQPFNRGRLWGVMGRVNQNLARYELAEQQLRHSLAAFAAAPDTVATLPYRAEGLRLLAICLHDLGRYDESEIAFGNALAAHRRAYPETTIVEAQLLTDAAVAVQAQGRRTDALDMLRQAVILAGDLGDEGRVEAAYILNLRGYVLYQLGRYQESLADMSSALATQRELLSGDSMDLVNSLNNLGGMNIELGRFAAAESLIVESREMLERIFQGEEHPSISRALLHLGRIALARGDTALAISNIEAGYGQYLRQVGPDHPRTVYALPALAIVRQCQGRPDQARRLFEKNLATSGMLHGPTHFKTQVGRQDYGRFLLTIGDLPAARTQIETVIAGWLKEGLPDHPRLLESRVDLAETLLRSGDPAGARAELESALPGLQEVFGPGAPVCVRARGLLAETS